ncbi:ABC transporter substrate-binding protein [Actinoplanes ianthinogenes]|uniref:ABC transporter substrate-binding protein n=1 Tax=Actinoplanes ianthinogenes TaxID=122358 RepID=A0ABN6CPG6_9ACTN|nr:ABC transporter substrate-binding protein [Actinoplanes ianthinogenes]BCJ46037.1 ABC transporter substrate-binding protein [Actinoplanes ianthinogenes]GGR25812.1 ABC transporter substrate-binding protein [Actinoplanes ianthinogenes]
MRIVRVVALAAVVVLLTATAACTGGDRAAVTVLASWTGGEAAAFRQVLDRFTDKTGIKVDLQGTRALNQVLTAEVQKGTPPDIAVLPSLGDLAGYVRRSAVRPLTGVIDAGTEQSHSAQWLRLEQLDNARYSVAVKTSLKSLIWYDPSRVPDLSGDKPPTWDGLVKISERLSTGGAAAWCMGMGSTPVSGWPGTDWIEDFVLHQAGPGAYQRWAAGKLAWTAPEIKQAWQAWGRIALRPGFVRGGASGLLFTDFGDAGRAMSADPPGCFLHHQASFVAGDAAGLDFMPFPSARARAWEVSADLAALFTDKPEARELMRFLATDEAQSIWPAASHGSVFSANRGVDPAIYDDPVTRRIAETLTGDATLCFDASDLMPSAMTNAFYRAVLEFLQSPDDLDRILTQLDRSRTTIPATDWLTVPCGT